MHRFADPVGAALALGDDAGAVEVAVLGEDAELVDVGELDEAAVLFGLLLHAVNASPTMATVAMPCTVFFTTPPVSFPRIKQTLRTWSALADLHGRAALDPDGAAWSSPGKRGRLSLSSSGDYALD